MARWDWIDWTCRKDPSDTEIMDTLVESGFAVLAAVGVGSWGSSNPLEKYVEALWLALESELQNRVALMAIRKKTFHNRVDSGADSRGGGVDELKKSQ
uniref:Uncharacterized protein n=1 Tax=Chromera velia CCMP2878 TaxID=1169474 RepID=A0A0K6S8D9_9ALVE|eukprot:Cvel_5996.t1-p1 / transcript=Cvel_5996.t1 / gene=Cvel_5996 / organism=Chromera_velia_CCMP2878 / gene_product=hypothetical protein / transcript_product=hypothetical protein / location=Cvel_scaffold287:30914-31204(+) / protein_length=97 / sequence_SO=supercontig / SO=protein_coding / is_pseudo=false